MPVLFLNHWSYFLDGNSTSSQTCVEHSAFRRQGHVFSWSEFWDRRYHYVVLNIFPLISDTRVVGKRRPGQTSPVQNPPLTIKPSVGSPHVTWLWWSALSVDKEKTWRWPGADVLPNPPHPPPVELQHGYTLRSAVEMRGRAAAPRRLQALCAPPQCGTSGPGAHDDPWAVMLALL